MTPSSELNKVTFSIDCDSLIAVIDNKTINAKNLEKELKETIQESLSKSGIRTNADMINVTVKHVESIN